MVLADVYTPTGGRLGETFPVILSISPYRKDLSSPLIDPGHDLVKHGYIQVVAEQQDGPEVVDWAAKVAHSNGKVGMCGQSYSAEIQVFTAARSRPGRR